MTGYIYGKHWRGPCRRVNIPCLYLLVDTKGMELYVGQTGDASRRIAEHRRKLSHGKAPCMFNKVVIIWDRHPIPITLFNDEAVRKGVESHLIRAFIRDEKFFPTNKSLGGSRAATDQAELIEALAGEILFALHRLGYLGRQHGRASGGEGDVDLGGRGAVEPPAPPGFGASRRRGPWDGCRLEATYVTWQATARSMAGGWPHTQPIRWLAAGTRLDACQGRGMCPSLPPIAHHKSYFASREAPRMAALGRGEGSRGRFGFSDWSDGNFRDAFTSIISRRGRKNNTYKFAWARFLLDHSHDPGRVLGMYGRAGRAADPPDAPAAGSGQVTYAEIARYFFVYYWPLVCKTRLRQGPVSQPPQVTQAIEKEFDKGAYPQSVRQIIRRDRPRVDRCVKAISRVAFKQVVYRFQKVGGREDRMFYQYAAGKPDKEGNRRIDRRGGILVNPEAARFLRENYAVLNGALTVEWLRAIESYNFGSPNLVERLSGDYGKRDQRKFLRVLEALGATCFYCGDELVQGRCTHIDHVLPFDYMGDTELWNLVLACQRCNCEKLCSLPPQRYIDKLMCRNADHAGNEAMAESLDRMAQFGKGVKWHYENARRHGYRVVKALPAARG